MKVNRDAARVRAREALDRGGRWWRAGAPWRRATARRAVAVGLTGLLLFGQVPAAAWAAEAEALGHVAQNVVAFAQNAGEGVAATDAVGAEGTAADGAAGAGDTAAGADSAEGTIATDAGDGATSAATDDASPETAADAAPATDAPATDAAAPSAADGTTAPGAASQAHTGAAYLLIQDAKDAASSEGRVEGAVSAGATLWANLFIGGEDADGADADAAVAAQDGWSYQWYACGTASARIDDYEPIAGQTAQSLVLTEDLAEQLAGSYLAVAVTVDGECHVGPAERFGTAQGALDTVSPVGPVTAPPASASAGAASTAPEAAGTSDAATAGADESPATDEGVASLAVTAAAGDAAIADAAVGAAPARDAGRYTLSGIKLSSSGQAAQAGNVITATAQVRQGYYDVAAPADAALSFIWEVQDEAGSWQPLDERLAASGKGDLLLLDGYVGKTLRVRASALDNEVVSESFTVLAAGTYDLLRVTTSPLVSSSTTQLFTGDTVTATVQARRLGGSATYGDNVTGDVAIQWYAADAAEGPFAAIDGADGASLTIGADLAGFYLKAVATSGSSTVEIAAANPVIDATSLAGIAAKLADESWRPEFTYGVDTNLNDVLRAKLAHMGADDVAVRTVAVEVSQPAEGAVLGISTDDASNGAITYFFMDPDDLTGWGGFIGYRTFTPTFELARDGETVLFTPERMATMPWDEARVEEMLASDAAAALAIGYTAGDAAESVTQDVTLPLKLADKSWSTVSWTSSDEDVVRVTGNSWDKTMTGAVTRPAEDAEVTLTATVGVVTSGGPEVAVEVPFTLTVKADPAAIEEETAALAAKVDAAFTPDALTYSADGAAVDAAAVAGDLQLPTTRALGIDGKYYTVAYAASTDALVINGYRANVYQPLPGGAPREVELALTVTSKDNPAITATKTIALTVSPLTAEAIDAELALMEEAAAGYAAALLDGQGADAVTGDLAIFQKAYRAEDGSLAWARDYAEASAAGDGIETVDLEADDEMGVVPGHWFKSSDAGVVAHDTLRVTQPEYDTQVTVTSMLASERFARYAERYADDATWGPAFTRLAGQEVRATFTVAGTRGPEDPDVEATVAIIGADAFGEDQVWVARTSYDLAKGSTAADLIEAALADAGLAHEASGVGTEGYYLSTITAADGRVLGWDEATGKYWQLFVDGAASDTGAGQVALEPGTDVVLYYAPYGASPEDIGKAKITVTAQIIGPDAGGADASWMGLTEISLPQGSTAADLTERALALAGLEADTGTGSYGWFLNSITSPITGESLGTVETSPGTWSYWQLFVDGAASDLGAGSVELDPGTQVVWYYSAYGAELPANDVTVDPDAWDERPSDWEAAWEGFAPGALAGIATPTEGGELAWAVATGATPGSASAVYQSDPVIAGGRVFLAVGDTLRAYDSATGAELARATLATSIDSVCRLVFADGLIVVPLHGGRLQVLTADTLTTVSLTSELAAGAQALSSVTVRDGYAYFGTTDGAGAAGALFCVNLRTGAVAWSTTGSGDAGYYWTGAVRAGDRVVAVDGAGTVRSLDAATGADEQTLALGAAARAALVADPSDASTLYAVTQDGTLHRITVAADGSLALTDSVRFAASSTSTPTIADGRAYVGGATEGYTGVLAVIDLATMTVEHEVTGFANEAPLPGDVKAAPTVAVQGDATYVYFTCNAATGAVYRYRLGDDAAVLVYEPTGAYADWCMASVAVDAEGALYYVNDSGHLFRIDAGAALPDPEAPADPEGSGTSDGAGQSGTASGAGGATGGTVPQIVLTGTAADAAASNGDAADAADAESQSLLSAFARVGEDGAVAAASAADATEGPRAPLAAVFLLAIAAGVILIIGLVVTRRRAGEE